MTPLVLLAGGGVEESEVSAGPIGLLIVLLMLIATALLIRNMNGRLKRLPRDFPEQQEPQPDDRDPGRPRI
jgi:hypothetical protein